MTKPLYRDLFYERYASVVQDNLPTDPAHDERWIRAMCIRIGPLVEGAKRRPSLDVGCGSGRLLEALKRLGFERPLGLDSSPEQVALARRRGHEVVHGDVVTFLRQREGSFGLITAIDVVEHLTKSEMLEFLFEARAALMPGGILVIQTPNADSPFAASAFFNDFTHEWCLSPRTCAQVLTLSGFSTVRTFEVAPLGFRYGALSFVRRLAWRCLSVCIASFNLIETGHRGSGIYTRNFMATASTTGLPEA